MTLQRKLALGSALAVLLSALGATGLIVYSVRNTQNSQVNELMSSRLSAVVPDGPMRVPDLFGNTNGTLYLPRDLIDELHRTERARTFKGTNGPLLLVDIVASGQHVPARGITAMVSTKSIAARPGVVTFHDVDLDGAGVNSVRVAQVAIDDTITVRVLRSVDDLQRSIQRIAWSIILIGAGIALVSAAVTALFVGRTLRPLRELAITVARAGETQDLSLLRREPDGSAERDEVGELSESLSAMAESVIESRAYQQRLVDDAAHELRTPLTSLRTNLQLLQESLAQGRPLGEDVIKAALSDSVSESEELTSLIDELVALSVVAGPTLDPGSHQDIHVGDLVSAVVTRAQRRSGRAIEVNIPDATAAVFGNYARLDRAVTNIVNNALKFAPTGRVRITVSSNDAVDIVVEDSGSGIPLHERMLVTQRFWRSTAARALPGSGLGLSIVADVASEFAGTVLVDESRDLGGAKVTLRLPAASA